MICSPTRENNEEILYNRSIIGGNIAFVWRHILKPLLGMVLRRWQNVNLAQVTKLPSEVGALF